MWGQIIRYFWIRRNILLCHTFLLCHYTSLVNECVIDSFPNSYNSVFPFIWEKKQKLTLLKQGRLIAWFWSWIRLYFGERSVHSSPPYCRFLSGMAVVAQEAGRCSCQERLRKPEPSLRSDFRKNSVSLRM